MPLGMCALLLVGFYTLSCVGRVCVPTAFLSMQFMNHFLDRTVGVLVSVNKEEGRHFMNGTQVC